MALDPRNRPRSDGAQRRDGDTEARILDAARKVFIRHGTSGARMQEIAAEAGVNQALLHYYFRSKERLAAAVFREAAGRLMPRVARLLAADIPLDRKVEQFVHLYIDNVREHPFIPGYILAELHQHPERLAAIVGAGASPAAPTVAPMAAAVMARLGAQLAALEREGRIRQITPGEFVVNLLALVVFPFAVRPALRMVLGFDEADFGQFLDERRATLPGLIMNALRP